VSALIYNEVIRDMINTQQWLDPWPPHWITKPDWIIPGTKPPWVSLSEARSRNALHEILHYFIGNRKHSHDTTAPENRGIMNTNMMAQNQCLYEQGTCILDAGQIAEIQRTKKTAPRRFT
jgi:hypothetical protein